VTTAFERNLWLLVQDHKSGLCKALKVGQAQASSVGALTRYDSKFLEELKVGW
jgi:hypothetical protein